MIRRDAIGPGGRRCWTLISQIEHARVAGEVAAHWGAEPFAPLVPRDELLPAIIRHDDGWSRWERRPEIDPETSRPRDFTEMPLDESLVIWRDSIERAAELGELAGYVVAGHFLNLLQHSAAWREHGTRGAAAAQQWAAEIEASKAEWLQEWCSLGRSEHTPAVAEATLAKVQFFDRLSLWLCVAQQTEPAAMTMPDEPTLQLIPQGDRIVLDPWPLSTGSLELAISGRQVPERRYADAADLAAEPQPPVVLRLTLVQKGRAKLDR